MSFVKKRKEKTKVTVAMSGGVDSGVAAALLAQQGYEVTGVFMKLWVPEKQKSKKPFENKYYSGDSEKRARLTARKIGIPFYVLDFEQEFKKKVVNYFLKANRQGLTPNPCVVCNREIKLGLLLEKSLKLGADYVATGHYARIFQVEEGLKIRSLLASAKDKSKDQSYFLWKMSQSQLKRILFPIGSYTKIQVKEIAKKLELPVFGSKESMEICFIEKTINDFLKTRIGEKKGRIINDLGEELSEHNGLWFYTIGQRKGICLSKGPYYVLDRDFKKNILIVTKNEKKLYKKKMIAKEISWISGKKPELPLTVKAKIRYRQSAEIAKIDRDSKSKSYSIEFNKPQRAITPGQSVVFYSLALASPYFKKRKEKAGHGQHQKEAEVKEVLGGGIIRKAL